MASNNARRINNRTGVSLERIDAVVRLIDEGAPIPFIARYRKADTGNLDERGIRQIARYHREARALDGRRREMLETIEASRELTAELREQFDQCDVAEELEDLYLPFRTKRQSKANLARRRGLEPLADYIRNQEGPTRVEDVAMGFLSYERKVVSVGEAIEGALLILADRVSQDSAYRRWLRNLMLTEGEVRSKAVKSRRGRPGKYASYDGFSEKVAKIPSHRMLAVRRGTREKFLTYSIEIDDLKARSELRSRVNAHAILPSADLIRTAVDDAYARLLRPVIESEVRNILKDRAENEAVTVFEDNLSALLLSPPAGRLRIIGIDPVGKGRSKVAAVSEDGNLIEHRSMKLFESARENQSADPAAKADPSAEPQSGAAASDAPFGEPGSEENPGLPDTEEPAAPQVVSPPPDRDPPPQDANPSSVPRSTDTKTPDAELLELLERTEAKGIVIGSGSGTRPVERFIRKVVSEHGLDVFVTVSNDVSGEAYAASEPALAEFDDLDVPTRRAISIARRLQDPLAEMVKVEPRSIGVGQYQHDVSGEKLEAGVVAALETAVNRVGADLNSASEDLLKWISGLSVERARAIVEHRKTKGPFTSREQLETVPGIDRSAFTYAAGFLRITDGSEPLDSTRIHPDHYGLVSKLAESVHLSARDLLGNGERLRAVRFADFESEVGRFVLDDIRDELYKPWRDFRKAFHVPRVDARVLEIGDLEGGMDLEGTVTNVTNFGAFVDIGVGQDGLVHISELAHRYVSDARQAVQIGDVVKVKVISVEKKQKRISLSIKAATPKPQPARRNRPRPHAQRRPQLDSRKKPSNGRSRDDSRNKSRTKTTVSARERGSQSSRPRREAAPKKQHESISHLSMEEQIRRLQEKFKGPDKPPRS